MCGLILERNCLSLVWSSRLAWTFLCLSRGPGGASPPPELSSWTNVWSVIRWLDVIRWLIDDWLGGRWHFTHRQTQTCDLESAQTRLTSENQHRTVYTDKPRPRNPLDDWLMSCRWDIYDERLIIVISLLYLVQIYPLHPLFAHFDDSHG